MDRIQALTIYLKSAPTEDMLQIIYDNGGEYSPKDNVTGLENVCWFEYLEPEVLIALTENGNIFSGTEQRYKVETDKLDDKGDTIFEAVTKETFKQHKETLMTADKASDIMAARRPVEDKLG